MEYDKELIDDMMAMGMQEALLIGRFSGMANEDLFISLLQQFTYVKVNEEDEAAAVNCRRNGRGRSRTKYVQFRSMDRPFIFLIKREEYRSYSVYG